MKQLSGKTAVIIGGSKGIGFAAAKTFHQHGARVVLFGRTQETLDRAAAELGGETKSVLGDLGDLQDLDRLMKRVEEMCGGIDVLCANAGVSRFVPLEQCDEATFDQVFQVNVKGTYFAIQKALPILRRGASVILTSSSLYCRGMPNSSVYAASKAAIRSMARTLSAELVGRGIRVNAICPGPVDTTLWNDLGIPEEHIPELREAVRSGNPMLRFAKPEELARAFLFLASDDSAYMAGTAMMIDGGESQL